jgi:hypothetical protein
MLDPKIDLNKVHVNIFDQNGNDISNHFDKVSHLNNFKKNMFIDDPDLNHKILGDKEFVTT